MPKQYIIVDVGCIECGEETYVLGVYSDKKEAENAFVQFVGERKIEKWEPAGGFLEFFRGSNKDKKSTYLAGTGYFSGGQHSLEVHVLKGVKK